MLIPLVLVVLVAVPGAALPAIAKRRSWSDSARVESTAWAWIAVGLGAILVGVIWALAGTARWWSITAFVGGALGAIGGVRDLRKVGGHKR